MSNDGRHDSKMGFLVDLAEGFDKLVKLGIGAIFVLFATVLWLAWLHFFSEPETAAPNERPAAAASPYSPVAPDVRPVVANLMGECFSTPMGDVGKVLEQDNEMLTMTFRGGVKSTYRVDQVSSSACGPAVVK